MSNARELAELGGSYGSGGFVGMKNRIINGAMVIDQRNAGASISNNGYAVDRFLSFLDGSAVAFTSQQSSTAPAGFVSSLLSTVTSSGTQPSGNAVGIQQRIEGLNVADLGWGTASAQSVTLSFWVRSSLTGTFSGALSNSAFNRSYAYTFAINSANTWEQKTITIAGDQSGTWLTTNGIGIRVYWDFGSGSTYKGSAGSWAGAGYVGATGSVSLVGTNGATFYITGVQLEKGSTATSFDYRPYGTELALCQRYFQKTCSYVGVAADSGMTRGILSYLVKPRAQPTLTQTGVFNITDGYTMNVTQSSTGIAVDTYGESYARIALSNFSGLTAGRVILVNTTESINVSAEL